MCHSFFAFIRLIQSFEGLVVSRFLLSRRTAIAKFPRASPAYFTDIILAESLS
ncbi:hypothetical protein COO91_03239 [Nostoc flagelliforme CCNUN1]|uniref:Uncharacterized protein n=1 Tax=Nostoc flagelliforme CCNUN1 TaxID=2038116 RepID=A0A2K8SPE7_9NOSO|nr:hypothetical protein COO91_03239 [Nostoc flagelliforme CCNUN1]